VAEVDSGCFGRYVKPANFHEYRADRRFAVNQSGERKAVVVIRERKGKYTPRRVPHRRTGIKFHPLAHRQGYGRQRGRVSDLERVTQSLRKEADQS
jgi:hypothetical protein